MKNKKIYVAYTGGTIGMKPSAHGFIPESGYLTKAIQKLSASLAEESHLDIVIHEYNDLIDSSNIEPTDWVNMAQDIYHHYNDFDGFVILHGTDTMAYTASALSFMLDHLNKPVIITGSQLPFNELRSDGRDNIISSLLLAANSSICEVCLYFHDRLYRGNRAQKVDSSAFHAFDSPNFPALARLGTEIHLNKDLLLPPSSQDLTITSLIPQEVAVITLFPGLSENILNTLLSHPIKGLILQTYGMGNAPNKNKPLLATIESACQSDIIVMNISQCFRGHVDMEGYETGQNLHQCGVISGYDMTIEAALTKLYFALSLDLKPQDTKKILQTNLKGELSID